MLWTVKLRQNCDNGRGDQWQKLALGSVANSKKLAAVGATAWKKRETGDTLLAPCRVTLNHQTAVRPAGC